MRKREGQKGKKLCEKLSVRNGTDAVLKKIDMPQIKILTGVGGRTSSQILVKKLGL